MSFWNGETLAERLPSLISPYSPNNIDCAAYTLCVGPEVYVSPTSEAKDPKTQTKVLLSPGGAFAIPPGQFAILLTEETIEIPARALGFISIKAKRKWRGLVNISGFHVDPGYKGRLIFSVFNASPATVHLARGEPCFLIWYADLDHETKQVRPAGQSYQTIPTELINPIAGEIQSFEGLLAKIKTNDEKVSRELEKIAREQVVIRTIATVVATLLVALAGRYFLMNSDVGIEGSRTRSTELPQSAPASEAPISPPAPSNVGDRSTTKLPASKPPTAQPDTNAPPATPPQ